MVAGLRKVDKPGAICAAVLSGEREGILGEITSASRAELELALVRMTMVFRTLGLKAATETAAVAVGAHLQAATT